MVRRPTSQGEGIVVRDLEDVFVAATLKSHVSVALEILVLGKKFKYTPQEVVVG